MLFDLLIWGVFGLVVCATVWSLWREICTAFAILLAKCGPPNFLDDPEFAKLRETTNSQTPAPWRDYELESTYAHDVYADQIGSFEALDSKGEFILKFCVSLIGAIMVVSKTTTSALNLLAYSSILAFVLAALIAIRVRLPANIARPDKVLNLLSDFATRPSTDTLIRHRMAKDYGLAAEGLRVTGLWKSRQLVRASGFAALGVTLFALWVMTAKSDDPIQLRAASHHHQHLSVR